MNTYVVTMYRWGDKENHSYVLGVYDDVTLALKEAEREQMWRGGNKYFPEVEEFTVNETKSRRIIHRCEIKLNALTEEERKEWIKKIYDEE